MAVDKVIAKIMWLTFFGPPCMLHGLLADSVDTSLASLLYSCTTDAVFSEVHDQ